MLLLRFFRALLLRLLGRTNRAIAQQAADSAAITRNQDAAHDAHAAQAAAPRDRADLARSVRDGSDF